MIKDNLLKKYYDISSKLGIYKEGYRYHVNLHIREIIQMFMGTHRRVAIFCNGFHTKMLMTDFVSDLRDVICIIDQDSCGEKRGINIIKDQELESYDIDGVIISSFKYKEDIKQFMSANYPNICVLDIYEELRNKGIFLRKEYYSTGPYHVYNSINAIKNSIKKGMDNKVERLSDLLKLYVLIKDFRMAIEVSSSIYKITDAEDDKEIYYNLKELYDCQLSVLAKTDKNNVLLMCMDGMRYIDLSEGCLNKTMKILKNKGRVFSRAYSYSTMTFESLVPAFSENSDQRTGYFRCDEVKVDECRFCKVALNQGRKIYVYGDGYKYISGDSISYAEGPQTLTEKLWDLCIDLCDTDNGLFYLHELYESHFSFPNPYTEKKIVANGTAMLFDYLPKNGGRLQTDYSVQLEDSLRYIDDTLEPVISNMSCSLLLFADHGNLVLQKDSKLSDIKPLQLSAAEEWIRIPWVIVSENILIGEDYSLISLLDINDVVISMLEKKDFLPVVGRRFIKIGRSEIYNPDFKELYKMMDLGYYGEAFEGFIFEDGYKLMIYSNGRKELYRSDTEELVNDSILLNSRYEEVSNEISIL